MEEEGELDLLPLFPDEDDQDRVLDQRGQAVDAPALLRSIPDSHQLCQDSRLAARLLQVKQLA